MRVTKIALLVVLASLGGLFAFTGARLWSETHRTTSTIFERTGGGEDAAGSCGNIDLVDKPFLLQRAGAAVIFLLGASTMLWASASMLSKDDHGPATS